MKNKTKKVKRILCLVLLILVVQIMGITYAKYVAQEKGTGQAEVANWAFEIEKDGEKTKTVKLEDTALNGKIAPGSNGVMKIVLDAEGSDVDIDYAVQLSNEKNKPTNLTFTYLGTKYKSLSEIPGLSGQIKASEEEHKRSVIIRWSWPYETGKTPEEIAANDIIDTQEANLNEKYTFDITAMGTQSE